MIVDVHGHLVPPEQLAAIRKEAPRLPSLRLIEEGGALALQFGSAKPTRPAMKGLSDVAGRIAWMDKEGIDRHVVGTWPDWLGNDLPAAEGEIWCRLVNDALLAAAKAQPRFIPLAAVPLQDGARAASVLKAAMIAGFPGAMISTLPRGIGSVLDAPDLDPFW
jgi:aminocarboxymuconate-semialdehyde decarboxylase